MEAHSYITAPLSSRRAYLELVSSHPIPSSSSLTLAHAHFHQSQNTPIIYVNFNYRLGALGFPIGDDATSEDVLNLGLKDQRLALEWVQENINAFGGDSAKVCPLFLSCLSRSPR